MSKRLDVERNKKLLVADIMPRYIGAQCTRLLTEAGFKTLGDLANAPGLAISGIGGIGPKRLFNIEKALNEHRLMLQPACFLPMPLLGLRLIDSGLN